MRLIAASLPRRQIAYALAVYDVLVLLCNDHGDKTFTEHVSTICELTGMSYKGVARALDALSDLGLISVSDVAREATGVFARRTFEIAKGPLVLSPRDSATGSEGVADNDLPASASQPTLSAPSIQPVELLCTESPNKERTEEQERKNDDDDAREADQPFVASPALEAALESHLGPFFWRREILELVEDFVREHTEQQLLKALQVATTSFVERKSLFSWLSTTLASQKQQGYTWAGPPSKEERRKVERERRDPEATFFQKNRLYRVLEADLVSGPAFAGMRIRELCPKLNIDVTPFEPLNADPPIPKTEQIALIRDFVRASLRASSPPATTHAVEGAAA